MLILIGISSWYNVFWYYCKLQLPYN